MTLTCQFCKKELPVKKTKNHKYCRACSAERNKTQARENYRKKNAKVSYCADCKCLLEDNSRTICHTCKEKAKRQARLDSFVNSKARVYKKSGKLFDSSGISSDG